MKKLDTPWGEMLDRQHPLPEYPRPQLVRDSYLNLNGPWQYRVTEGGSELRRGTILVPFSPESHLSGCDFQLMPGQTLHYSRSFSLPEGFVRSRVLLHFGAVDQCCAVRVNGQPAGEHADGYLPFCLDITGYLQPGENLLEADVTDASDSGIHAYGKQRLRRGGIWYTPQSGIWQTVWMESVPENYVRSLKLTPDFFGKALSWQIDAVESSDARIRVCTGGRVIASGTGAEGTLQIPEGEFRPWSPEDPFLYDVEVSLGEDRVTGYLGMRSFGTGLHKGRRVLTLNGKPYFQTGLLDQGYWSDGLYTAPSDEAMIYDIRTMKDMGFNMLRKHIKVEPLRWYYHCDRLGMLVWQDAVSGGSPVGFLNSVALPFVGIHRKDRPSKVLGREDPLGCAQFESDLETMIRHLYNVTSLCLWVPFNEGWGQFDAARIAEKVKALDPTRPVDHASGWHDQGAGDLRSYHIYIRPISLRHDGRRALALTEFGGYSLALPEHCATDLQVGYVKYRSREKLMDAVEKLYEKQVIPQLEKQSLSACVYTQVSDVEDEVNGLLTYDRRVVKVDMQRMEKLNEKLKF